MAPVMIKSFVMAISLLLQSFFPSGTSRGRYFADSFKSYLGDHLCREELLLRRTKEEMLNELLPKRRIVHEINDDEKI